MPSQAGEMIGAGRQRLGAESTVGDAVRAAAPLGYPAGIFSAAGLARVEVVADQLPGRLTSTFGFEIQLEKAPAAGDFAIAVTGLHGGREMLAGSSDFEFRLASSKEPAWAAVRALSRAWVDPLSGLDAELHNLALEFDLVEGEQEVPPPNVFLAARSGISADSPMDRRREERSWAWLFDAALPVLRGRLARSQRDTLGLCFHSLPSGSRAFQVGVMLARPMEALRVSILGLGYDRLSGYLESIGWPADLQELDDQVAPLLERAESVIVDIDVADCVMPSIGIECFLGEENPARGTGSGAPQMEDRWSRFLEPLVRRGLCTPERRQALLDWPLTAVESRARAWPAHLRDASRFLGADLESSLVRAINHVKLSWRPDRPLQAKAYLRVQHRWRPATNPIGRPPAPSPLRGG
jgi:hypothetical protein